MSLSMQIKNQSLEDLSSICANNSSKKDKRLLLLEDLNALAASVDVSLNMQSPAVIKLIVEQVGKPFTGVTHQHAVESIYSLIIEQMDRETDQNKRAHSAQGHFDQKNIHQRNLRDELQDHDMTLLMPKSHGNIEVLASVNRFEQSTVAIQDGITAALSDEKINHVIFPVGPGHWRGVYLTKPTDDQGKYQLELFDPYGPIGADAIKQFALELLKPYKINEKNITITTTGPTYPQKDNYACGDFTCAHSHKKMKEFGAKNEDYNQDLMAAMEKQGNKDDSLRHASRLSTEFPPDIARKLVGTTVERELTPQEKRIFTTTISAQQNPSVAYKQEIDSLIRNRHSIFSQADAALKKEKEAQPLSDEEYAAKLQAEELTNAGFNPRPTKK